MNTSKKRKMVSPISSETMKEHYDTWRETRDESSKTPREFHTPIKSFA